MDSGIIGSIILWGILAVIVIAVITYLLHWLYYRSNKEFAFVRTGFGGEKVVIGTGALVLPIIHEVTPVNLNVIRISVILGKETAVLTKDRIRIDIDAEFFVKVRQNKESVAISASSLGRKTMEVDQMTPLLSGKFVSALRTVAANIELDEMHEQREEYVAKVMEQSATALACNGLELESVAITKLDQTDLNYYRPTNRFDADGLTRLVETIENRRKLRNDIEQNSMVAIRLRNLEAEKETLRLDQDSEDARLQQQSKIEAMRAEQQSEIKRSRLTKETETESIRIQSEQKTREREIARQRLVQAAEIKAKEDIELARIKQTQALDKSRIERDRLLRAQQISLNQSAEENQIVANEEIERARIASERGLHEAKIIKEQDLKRIEIEQAKAVDLVEIDRAIAILKKREDESKAQTASEIARLNAVAATEQVSTKREILITERKATIDRLMAEKDADVRQIAANAEKISSAVSAEAQRLLNEAENLLTDEARNTRLRSKLIDHLEGIVRESVRPLENIESIKVLHVDGFGNGSADGSKRSPTDEVIESALRYRAQAPLIDQMMKEIGIEDAGVARMGDIFRTARDAQAITKETEKKTPTKPQQKPQQKQED